MRGNRTTGTGINESIYGLEKLLLRRAATTATYQFA
jgi:hypothetical protein